MKYHWVKVNKGDDWQPAGVRWDLFYLPGSMMPLALDYIYEVSHEIKKGMMGLSYEFSKEKPEVTVRAECCEKREATIDLTRGGELVPITQEDRDVLKAAIELAIADHDGTWEDYENAQKVLQQATAKHPDLKDEK